MDSRKTTQGDGDERTTENVVRLPRDWLGPREELVPMGSRARTAAPVDDAPGDSLPPTAASFWDEDSGSLQAPMQAPADTWSGQWEPAAAEPAPPTSRLHGSTPHGRSIPRPRILSSSHRGFARRRRSTAAVLGLIAAGVVVVLAVIGQTEGGANTAGKTTVSASKSARIVTATGANLARLRATPVVTQITGEPISHHAAKTTASAARSRARAHRTHASKIRHRHRRPTPQPIQSAIQPVQTTPTYTPAPATTPATSAPTSGSTASSPSASTDRTTSSRTQHDQAFGSNGSLGPGSSPDS
jgi:hypothetical protein